MPSAFVIMVKALGTVFIHLSWTQSEQDIVENYLISFRGVSDCNTALSGIQNISCLFQEYNLTGLEENITYEVTVMAVNDAGSTASSITVTTQSASEFYFKKYCLNIIKTHAFFSS